MRRVVLDTDVASLIIKQRLPAPMLREIVGAQAGITFVTLGELTRWATKFGASIAGPPRTCRRPRPATSRRHGSWRLHCTGSRNAGKPLSKSTPSPGSCLTSPPRNSARFAALQFGVLRNYGRMMQFDANGRQVPRVVLKRNERHGSRADLGRHELPFTSVVREAEMTVAYNEFSRRVAEREAISTSGSVQG